MLYYIKYCMLCYIKRNTIHSPERKERGTPPTWVFKVCMVASSVFLHILEGSDVVLRETRTQGCRVNVIENIKCILFITAETWKTLWSTLKQEIHLESMQIFLYMWFLFVLCTADVQMLQCLPNIKWSSWWSCKGTVKHMCCGMKMGRPCKIGKQIRKWLLEVTTVSRGNFLSLTS